MKEYLGGVPKSKHSRSKNTEKRLVLNDFFRREVLEKDGHFLFNNSSMMHISESFGSILSDLGFSRLDDFLKYKFYDTLLVRKLVGIEMGGEAHSLFLDLDGVFSKTAGVTLIKSSKDVDVVDQDQVMSPKNHIVIQGDIFDEGLYKNEFIKNTKFDFILERMFGGLSYVGNDYFLFYKIINKWWNMLYNNGVMFIQLPKIEDKNKELYQVLIKWLNLLKKSNVKILFHRDGYSGNELGVMTHLEYPVLYLEKNNNINDLPFLNVEDIL